MSHEVFRRPTIAWFTVLGVDGESGVYQIPLDSERQRLNSLGVILESFVDREEAEESFEDRRKPIRPSKM